MNRVERFKEVRKLKRKYMLVVLFLILFMISGICIADYSINNLMYDDNHIEVISIHNSGAYLEISILKSKIYINTTSMKKDYEKVKGLITGLFRHN